MARLTPFECSEVGFDAAEAGLLVGDLLRDLRLPKAQHPAQLLDRRIAGEQLAHLLQCEAEVSQRQEAVELAELGHLVGPVAARRVDLPGPEQADLVVVPQHARRHLAEPGELSDVQHAGTIDTPSHGVKVKGSGGLALHRPAGSKAWRWGRGPIAGWRAGAGTVGRRMSGLVVREVVVDGHLVDVRASGGVIVAIEPRLTAQRGEVELDGRRGALVPGLHDHHTHLLALGAADRSTPVGPPAVSDAAGLAAALTAAGAALPPGEWLRAVGYHESVAGPLDRHRLDALVPDRPVRVQHRSGAAWILNSRALALVGLDGPTSPPGNPVDTGATPNVRPHPHLGPERPPAVEMDGDTPEPPPGAEVDGDGTPTGRLFGLDGWLRERLPRPPPPDLAAIGRRLASFGVTGVTDATPVTDLDDLAPLAAAVRTGDLPQRITVTGGPALAASAMPAPLARGPVKLVAADYALPSLDVLARWMREAHEAGRSVAVHCVTRAALALALAAWEDAGVHPGDRVEHGSVVPPDLRDLVAAAGLTVVTQPAFVHDRGDRYLVDVDEDDRPHLYPCRSLLDAGIPVGGSTDAPFGDPDPWRAVATAVDRRTADGQPLGHAEAVPADRALALFLTPPDAPGGTPRAVRVGAPADLCLLDAPLPTVLDTPSSDHVAATIIAGDVAFAR
jgi:predicted amidohydrolase YtcJ